MEIAVSARVRGRQKGGRGDLPRDHGLTAQNRLVSGPVTPTELGFDIINGPTRTVVGVSFPVRIFLIFSQKDTIISPSFIRKETTLPAQ